MRGGTTIVDGARLWASATAPTANTVVTASTVCGFGRLSIGAKFGNGCRRTAFIWGARLWVRGTLDHGPAAFTVFLALAVAWAGLGDAVVTKHVGDTERRATCFGRTLARGIYGFVVLDAAEGEEGRGTYGDGNGQTS